MKRFALAALAALLLASPAFAEGEAYQSMVASHAAANGIPPALVHRVIMRESRYNPRAVHAGNYGMMQIRLQTARGLGYTGTAQGLLDPETNMTYAVRYLAGAYRAAGGNMDRAVHYYAAGYYYAAKRQRLMEANAMMPAPAMQSSWAQEPAPRIAAPRTIAAAPAVSPFADMASADMTMAPVRYVQYRPYRHHRYHHRHHHHY